MSVDFQNVEVESLFFAYIEDIDAVLTVVPVRRKESEEVFLLSWIKPRTNTLNSGEQVIAYQKQIDEGDGDVWGYRSWRFYIDRLS